MIEIHLKERHIIYILSAVVILLIGGLAYHIFTEKPATSPNWNCNLLTPYDSQLEKLGNFSHDVSCIKTFNGYWYLKAFSDVCFNFRNDTDNSTFNICDIGQSPILKCVNETNFNINKDCSSTGFSNMDNPKIK